MTSSFKIIILSRVAEFRRSKLVGICLWYIFAFLYFKKLTCIVFVFVKSSGVGGDQFHNKLVTRALEGGLAGCLVKREGDK